jgi:insertion element IS1 protein InsB
MIFWNSKGCGPLWPEGTATLLWLALCHRIRQVVAYWLGDRSETSAVHLWEQMTQGYVCCRSFSDKWEAYRRRMQMSSTSQ